MTKLIKILRWDSQAARAASFNKCGHVSEKQIEKSVSAEVMAGEGRREGD